MATTGTLSLEALPSRQAMLDCAAQRAGHCPARALQVCPAPVSTLAPRPCLANPCAESAGKHPQQMPAALVETEGCSWRSPGVGWNACPAGLLRCLRRTSCRTQPAVLHSPCSPLPWSADNPCALHFWSANWPLCPALQGCRPIPCALQASLQRCAARAHRSPGVHTAPPRHLPVPWRYGSQTKPPVPCRKLTWSFDLPGINDLYRSYETSDLWSFLRRPAQGITVGALAPCAAPANSFCRCVPAASQRPGCNVPLPAHPAAWPRQGGCCAGPRCPSMPMPCRMAAWAPCGRREAPRRSTL